MYEVKTLMYSQESVVRALRDMSSSRLQRIKELFKGMHDLFAEVSRTADYRRGSLLGFT